MTLEIRQLVLRAQVRDDGDDDLAEDDADGDDDEEDGCQDGCLDREALKEEILAACQQWLREQLRGLNER